MTKKIVAIGGGGCGSKKTDGTISAYDNQAIDEEIIKLTGKEKPNFLFLAHASVGQWQDSYYVLMKRIYGDLYHCECKNLKSSELVDKAKTQELIDWADIIYEGGGNTVDMLRLWEKTGFGEILKDAWQKGKVMCGLSAGGNCWFKECTTDYMQMLYGDDQPLIGVKALGFIDGHFTPHGEKEGRDLSLKEILKTSDQVGFLTSRNAAIEIIDDEYRILTSSPERFVRKCYWKDNKYTDEALDVSKEFKPLTELVTK